MCAARPLARLLLFHFSEPAIRLPQLLASFPTVFVVGAPRDFGASFSLSSKEFRRSSHSGLLEFPALHWTILFCPTQQHRPRAPSFPQ
jgi:hypothetical protein